MKNKIILPIALLVSGFFALNACSKDKCKELMDVDCVVPSEYEPVCGCNGKTYSHKDVAECAGVEYTNGKC